MRHAFLEQKYYYSGRGSMQDYKVSYCKSKSTAVHWSRNDSDQQGGMCQVPLQKFRVAVVPIVRHSLSFSSYHCILTTTTDENDIHYNRCRCLASSNNIPTHLRRSNTIFNTTGPTTMQQICKVWGLRKE